MTECERIIEQGVLPVSFFEEEVRCDFLVTRDRKKIWAIEIELLLKLLEICRKYNLTLWGDGGTLLGAVRHDGFIPWDDDLDVLMPRKDFNKLMEIAGKEFATPFFFQTPHTDPNFGYSFARLRNSNTTGMPRILAKAGYNHGIYIDIFPLDGISLDSFEDDKKRITECIMKNSSYMKRNSVNLLNERQLENYHKFWTENPSVEFDKIQEIASNPNYLSSDYVANAVTPIKRSENQIWKKEWFDNTLKHKFEVVDLPIPQGFDMLLKTIYGDYMAFPPVNQRGNWHSDFIWEPDKPFNDFLRENINYSDLCTK